MLHRTCPHFHIPEAAVLLVCSFDLKLSPSPAPSYRSYRRADSTFAGDAAQRKLDRAQGQFDKAESSLDAANAEFNEVAQVRWQP